MYVAVWSSLGFRTCICQGVMRLVMVYTPLNILERIELKSDNSKIIRKFIKY